MNKKYFLVIAIICLLIIGLVMVFGRPKTQPVVLYSPFPTSNIINSQIINDQGDKSLFKNAKYEIIFQQRYNLYLINILASPFNEIRQEAEAAFLGTLNISKDQACKINVFITTSASVNPNEAGQQYSLSFCQITSPSPNLTIIPSLLPLNITKVYPLPGLVEIGKTGNSIFITFDRDIDLNFVGVNISPNLKYNFQVHSVSSNELIIVPLENWQENTEYTITLMAGLKSKDGQYQLKQNYQFKYQTKIPVIPTYPPMGI